MAHGHFTGSQPANQFSANQPVHTFQNLTTTLNLTNHALLGLLSY